MPSRDDTSTTPADSGKLRAVCLGDSWVCDWIVNPADLAGSVRVCPLVDGLREELRARGVPVELTAAGFPGGTTERLLSLAKICRLHEICALSRSGRSIKYNVKRALELEELPTFASLIDGGASTEEDVDFVVMILGSNDLGHGASGDDVLRNLFKLRRIYRERGVDVITVSVGGGNPHDDMQDGTKEMEGKRTLLNAELLREDGVIDCDKMLKDFTSEMWENGWHLTAAGYTALGKRIAEAIAPRFSISGETEIELALASSSLLVNGCSNRVVSNIIAGAYAEFGSNHGRPVYRKHGNPGSAVVLLYFWEDKDNPDWGGWWFGPKLGWDDPGWARHADQAALTPPSSGWQVPPDGPVDTTLRVSAPAAQDHPKVSHEEVGEDSSRTVVVADEEWTREVRARVEIHCMEV